jgi:magnesium chelatase family protein
MILAEALDTTRPHHAVGVTGPRTEVVTACPCRALHDMIFDVGLIGGVQIPMPGETSLAYHSILCLEELPECTCHVLEVLRQPLEDGVA